MLALEWSALAVLVLRHLVRLLTVRCLARSQERREHQLFQFLAAGAGNDAARRRVAEALRALQAVPGPAEPTRSRPSPDRGATDGDSG